MATMRGLLFFCLLTVGCATQYQPMGWSGGYKDTQLAERVFEIEFAGNGYIGQSWVEAYAMRRAAEIAASRGYAGFVEVRDNTSTDLSLGHSYGNAYVVSKHSTKKRIYLLTAEEMPATQAAIDAKMILSRWPSPMLGEVAPTAAEVKKCRQMLAIPAFVDRHPQQSNACRETIAREQ